MVQLVQFDSQAGSDVSRICGCARQKWTSPMRLFLATSLLLFSYIALSDTQIVALGALEKKTLKIVALP